MVTALAPESASNLFNPRNPFCHPPSDSRLSMAGSMPASSDPIAISHPLPVASNPILSGTSESISLLKAVAPRPESHLSSIASAGLRTSVSPPPESSRSQPSPPKMTPRVPGPPPAPSVPDRPPEVEKGQVSQENDTEVAREALGAAIGVATERDPNKSNDTSANPATTLSAPMDTVAKSIQISTEDMQVDPPTSPPVSEAFGGVEVGGGGDTITGTSAPGLINAPTVASPGPIEEAVSPGDEQRPASRDEEEHTEDTNKAFSYPPPPSAALNDSRRGLSLPHSGLSRGAQRSSSTKKHRCPYCATEFTRHHNLKSHLLTHSQEKPYVCQTCNSRFRRLHDLKRHSKLHTGERPYICPKCERRFARGDALARHNKGQGGCAGRRASMGSFAGEDDYGGTGGTEEAMDGLMYTEPERMDEEDERRLNMPSIRKHNAPASEPVPRAAPSGTTYPPPRGPSTYPSIAANRHPGGLFPPTTNHAGSSSSTSPISTTGTMSFPTAAHSSASSYPSANMTESPKPLSPNALSSLPPGHMPEGSIHSHQQHRAQSPSRSHSYSQSGFRRGGPPSNSSPQTSLGLPPPQSGPPQLPPPPGMNAPDARYSLHGQGPPSNLPSKHGASHSHSSSLGAQTLPKPGNEPGPALSSTFSGPPDTSGKASVEQSGEDKLWAYVRTVHEELMTLRTEVETLRAQITSQNLTSSQNTSNLPPPNQPASGTGTGGSVAPSR